MTNNNTGFALTFAENLKRDANLSTTDSLSFDDLGEFIEEREKIKRALEQNSETTLRIDYSDFANHVFFDSAQSKFDIARKRILNQYPFNGTLEEKDAFHLTSSGYEDYIFEQWPRYIGYAEFDGATQFISASDSDGNFYIGSSSLCVSAWIKPVVSEQNMILQLISASTGPVVKRGYEFYLSGATDPHIKFSIYSGSEVVSVSAAYAGFTASFNSVAAMYDTSADLLSLYVNDIKQTSGSVGFGTIEFASTKCVVGSGSQFTAASSSYDFYSGSMDEVRVCHTASERWLQKNYSRPIQPATRNTSSFNESEDYLKLYYKFNEGVTGTGSYDSIIVDYSKSGLHGTYVGYGANSRVSGTVMLNDPTDPILYSFHSDVLDFSASMALSASLFDNGNNNFIFNMIPESILIEDEEAEGLYTVFTLAMARFFDQLKLYIDQFDNLRITNYDGYNETPDLFLSYLSRYFGWKVTEHFGNVNPLEYFFGEDVLSSGSLDVSLLEIKNQFWRRILNNLPYLLKTKGKRHNLDAFFNVLGINRENINLKEYGYLPGGSIQDDRIHKEKVVSLLGFGTGSDFNSFVKATGSITTSMSAFTVETLAQFPFASASYSGSLVSQGSVWQFIDPEQVTGSFTLLWESTTTSDSGKLILTSSDGQVFSGSDIEIFDGDWVHIAAGVNDSQLPFIEVSTIDNDIIDYSASFVGATALSGVFTGSKFDFVMGANSGTVYFDEQAQGFYGEYRLWDRKLSASELSDHSLHFESIGIRDPNEESHPLLGHWPLCEDTTTNSNGNFSNILDLSRNGLEANGFQFPATENPYQKFYLEYNYLSPSMDLKWTENKIRIRNKTELKLSDIASDTNEVSLEFNLVDALNEDITKIFSTFDIVNNVIGSPVNKYRDEYSDLESIRRKYFERLGDNIHFSQFFGLFKWFDRKLSDSIKQLLPARVRFVGGEQVVESHFLERSKYGYKYPIFRTPQEVPEAVVYASASIDGEKQTIVEGEILVGSLSGSFVTSPVSHYVNGIDERRFYSASIVYRRRKLSGDTANDVYDPNSGVNFRNEFARQKLSTKDKDNEG